MELIIYDKINTILPYTVKNLKIINITRRNGSITFFKGLRIDLGIDLGSKFLFAQDKSNKKNWFLILNPKSENSFSVVNKNKDVLGISNKKIVSEMFESFGNNKPSIKFLLAKDPITTKEGSLYQLIPIETETTKLTSKPKK